MNDITLPSKSDASTESIRVPPHSILAEQSVLGGLLLDNSAHERIYDQVVEKDFYRREHQLIFRSISKLLEQNKPCDHHILTEYLKLQGDLDQAGGFAYLGSLVNDTPSAANTKAYAEIVRERSILRKLIQAGSQISDSAFSPEGRDSNQLLDNAEQLVFGIAEQRSRNQNGFKPIGQLIASAVDRINDLSETDTAITGLRTGFNDFDDKTSGLQKSDLLIVAGRPSMGKTTFAINIAENVAIKERVPVAVFSLEMPGEQLAVRMISSLGRINQQKLRTGKLADDDWPRLTSSMAMLDDVPLFIDDTAGLTSMELRTRARRLAREQGQLGLIVIDYLQLMQGQSALENRTNVISEISRSLKSLAKELNVPIICLSQLNRNLEQRPNKRPVMSDLRESGSIEQDADLIIFIYRDEVYNKDTQDKGKAEIIIAKQRNGPIGTVALTFLGEYTRFENHAFDLYSG